MSDVNISGTRNLSVDLIKIIAMAMVVCRHTSMYFMFVDNSRWNLAWIMNSLSVACVPMFFMVTGYLLTGRAEGYRYVFRKLWAILRFVLLTVGIVWLYDGVLHPERFSTGYYYWNYLLTLYHAAVGKGEFFVYWYLFALGGVYLFYPLIERLVPGKRYYLLVLALLAVVGSVVFLLNITGRGEGEVYPAFRLWNWLFYFMLGGAIKIWPEIRKAYPSRLLGAMCLLSGAGVTVVRAGFTRMMPDVGVEYFYGFPVMILMSVCVFLWGMSLKIGNSRLVRESSALFLPVFVVHPFVVNAVGFRHFLGLPCAPFLFFVAVLAATVCLCWLLMKLKAARWLFRL